MDEKSQPAPPPYNPGQSGAPPPSYPQAQYPPQQPAYPAQQPAYPAQQPAYPAYPQQPTGYAQMNQRGPTGQRISYTSGNTGQPNVVYVQAPAPLANPPNDHLCFNIFVTICCFWPLGIFAIWKSIETRDAISRGDATRAAAESRRARRWGIITLVIGIICVVISVIIIGVYVGLVMAQLRDIDDWDK